MTYPNMDLQSLPAVIDLRVGTDPIERALQLSYWQVFAAIQAIHAINEAPQYPETVVAASKEDEFDIAIQNLEDELVAAGEYFNEIWTLEP